MRARRAMERLKDLVATCTHITRRGTASSTPPSGPHPRCRGAGNPQPRGGMHPPPPPQDLTAGRSVPEANLKEQSEELSIDSVENGVRRWIRYEPTAPPPSVVDPTSAETLVKDWTSTSHKVICRIKSNGQTRSQNCSFVGFTGTESDDTPEKMKARMKVAFDRATAWMESQVTWHTRPGFLTSLGFSFFLLGPLGPSRGGSRPP